MVCHAGRIDQTRIERRLRTLNMLVVDDNQYMRKIVRNLLLNVGVKQVFEAADGIAGLEAIRTVAPDLVILDWEMPLLNGAELVRIVRSPGVFPDARHSDHHAERPWRALARGRGGAPRRQRIHVQAGLRQGAARPDGLDPRASRVPIVQVGDYYGPQPRKLFGDPVRHARCRASAALARR